MISSANLGLTFSLPHPRRKGYPFWLPRSGQAFSGTGALPITLMGYLEEKSSWRLAGLEQMEI